MGRARRREWAALSLAAAASFCIPATVAGQVPASPPAKREDLNRPAWGTKDRILTHIGFTEFIPMSSGETYDTFNVNFDAYGLFPDPTGTAFGGYRASPHVPSGALLTYLELDYCDVEADYHVTATLLRCSYLGVCTTLASLDSDSGPSGCSYVAADLTGLKFTMDNFSDELILDAGVDNFHGAEMLVGAFIGYQLQLSPAPSTATFSDVPTTHPYFRAIEALAASGITAGCGNGNFCPNQNVTRGEMAVFLARALGLHFPN